MRKIIIHAFIIGLIICDSLMGTFNTLDEVSQYVKTLPEYPPFQNKDISNPDYSDFYRLNAPTFFSRFLQYVGIRKPLWSPAKFKDLLQKVVQVREKMGLISDFVLIQTPQPGTQFIVFGPILSSIHSLVRNLKELKRMGFINEELKLIKDDAHLVFDGNVINGAPYVLETLTLVLSLMNKNSDRVIYIRGQFEDALYWQNFALKNQLKILAYNLSDEQIPLNRLLKRFFNTLPLAIFLNGKDPEEGVIIISYFSIEDKVINEMSCIDNLKNFYPKMFSCKLQPKKPTAEVLIKAIVKGENRLITYSQNAGLSLLEPERGATAWSVFSAPNKIYQEYYNFYYDAFVIIKVGKKLHQSTITLFNQDVREKISYNKIISYDITTGQTLLLPTSSKTPFEELFKKKPIALKKQKQQKVASQKTAFTNLFPQPKNGSKNLKTNSTAAKATGAK